MFQRSGGLVQWFDIAEVGVLGLGGWGVADGREQAAVVLPVDPSEGLPLDVAQGAPWAEDVDDLGLEQADDAFGERVVVAVAEGPDRRVDAGLGEAFGVGDGCVLRPGVVVTDQPGQVGGPIWG